LEVPATPNPNWDSNTPDPATSNAPWRIYNIGGNNPINLMEYINALEQALGKTAIKEFFPLQPGDIPDTFANVDYLINEFNYKPNTGINFGVQKFVDWYLNYFHNSQPSKGNQD
jgi:UDP-glucuronate 4-epimerase